MYTTSLISEGETLFESGTIMVAIASFFATYGIAAIALYIALIIALWLIFKKAGKPGWASLIPVYHTVVLFQIVGLSPWLILLFLIPGINCIVALVFAIIVPFRLARSYGKGTGFGFGLWLLPSIFQLILGFGSAEYVGPNGKKE